MNLLQLSAVIASAAVCSPLPGFASGEKPVEEWTFENYSDGNTVNGSAGSSLACQGSIVANEGGADFTGLGYFRVGEGLGGMIGSAFSVVALVRPLSQVKEYGTIVSAPPFVTLRLMGKNLEVGAGLEWHAISAPKFTEMLDRWTQVAVTSDGGVYKLYLDGEEIGQKVLESGTASFKGSEICVGGRPDLKVQSEPRPPIECFPGVIKWVKVFDSALTADQLKSLK